MTDTASFPRELSELETAFPDTDAMLDELRELSGVSDEITDAGEHGTDAPTRGAGSEGEAPDPAATAGTEGGASSSLPPSVAPPGTVQIGDEFVPVQEAQALLEFSRRMRTEPEVATRVSDALTRPTEPAALPEWVDPDDAFQVNMYHQNQQAMAAQAQTTAELQARAQRDRQAHVVDSFRSALSNFRSAHPNLTETQVSAIAHSTPPEIIDGLERKEGSVTAAFERAMEMTMWSDPELRSLALADNAGNVAANKSSDRKTKQSALSGSGGSAPRTRAETSRPKTREDVAAQALRAIREDPTLSG